MSDRSWTDSLVTLNYAFHLRYLKKPSGFLVFIWVVFLSLNNVGKQLKPKLQALAYELE